MNIQHHFNNLVNTTSSNSPLVYATLAVIGIGGTAFLSAKAGYRTAKTLEEADIPDDAPFADKAKAVYKHYIPATTVGVGSAAAVILGNKASSAQTAAAVTAYSIAENGFRNYRDSVVKEIGEKKDEKIRGALAERQIAERPPKESQFIIGDDTKVLFREAYSGRYFNSDMETIKQAVNSINHTVNHELYASLNDFYEYVGLESTDSSDRLGWNSDKLLEISFMPVLSPDQKPCVSFTYNYVKPI